MNVDVRDMQGEVRIDKSRLKRWAGSVLREMGEEKAELSVILVSDAYIKKLNWSYRKVRSGTDVLAFPMREGNGPSRHGPILGDVVISIQTAKREAEKRGVPIYREIALYLAHGILHLLGYDDRDNSDRKRMKAKESELLEVM
jgi:probable rRNA maturation factor